MRDLSPSSGESEQCPPFLNATEVWRPKCCLQCLVEKEEGESKAALENMAAQHGDLYERDPLSTLVKKSH